MNDNISAYWHALYELRGAVREYLEPRGEALDIIKTRLSAALNQADKVLNRKDSSTPSREGSTNAR